MALVPVVLFFFSIHTLGAINQDLGRHIRVGEIVWQTHEVSTTNLFSYTAPDFPFINHHWLGGVLFYLGNHIVGLEGLILLKALVLAVAVVLAVAATYRRDLAGVGAWVGTLAVFILIERTDVRPEIFSFLYLAWFLCVMYRYQDSKLLWTLPLVQMLWVNTHIYFFMGFVVWGAFLVGQLATQRSFRIPRRLLALGALLTIATLINPSFLKGALYPLTIFNNYGYSIVENKSPFFLSAFGYPPLTKYALLLGIGVVAVSFLYNIRHIRENIPGLVLAAGTAVGALLMVRNFPLFAIVMVPVVLKNVREVRQYQPSLSSLVGTMTILLVLIWSIVHNQIYTQAHLGRSFGTQVPNNLQGAVDFIKQERLKGPLFNNFDIGSFLIWQLPEERVFIDGRPEAYPKEFIQTVYIPMQENPDVWERYAAHYNLRLIVFSTNDITPWAQSFIRNILQNPSWVPVYYRENVLVLVRNIPENAELMQTHGLRTGTK